LFKGVNMRPRQVRLKVVRVRAPGLLLLVCVLISPLLARSQVDSAQSGPEQTSLPDWSPAKLGAPLLRDPIWVYNDWSAYDELSDYIPLTEELAMRELDQILRLRKLGVHFDYYMMDAFWFAKDGAYRTFRAPDWPRGPDAWIAKCRANSILPGLWFGANGLVKIDAAPEWRDSLNAKGSAMSFYEGGFLPHFMDTLQIWYGRGIRMFEFDFADFDVATPAAEKSQTRAEIRSRNEQAFREALKKFRLKNPDIVLVAFNGFGGDMESTAGPFPFRHPVDLRWLEVFDSIYTRAPPTCPKLISGAPWTSTAITWCGVTNKVLCLSNALTPPASCSATPVPSITAKRTPGKASCS
jgi:hypothetical protein